MCKIISGNIFMREGKHNSMRPIVLIFLFISVGVFVMSLPLLSQRNRVTVTAERANIHVDPDEKSAVVETVEKGTVLNLFSSEKIKNIWYRVYFYSIGKKATVVGYIHISMVKEVGEVLEAIEKEIKPKEKKEEIKEAPKIKEIKPEVVSPPKPRVRRPSRIKTGPKSYLGVMAGYSMLRDVHYSDEMNYGGNFCLGISKNVSIELSGLRFQNDVESSVDGLSEGQLSVIPIQLSIQLRLPVTRYFVPYILGGGGYYLNSFALDEEIINAWDALGFDVNEKIENSIGYHAGAGFDIFITGKIALSVDVKYCLVKAKGSWSLSDQIGGTVTSGAIENLNLNTIMFGAGLKFCF